MTVLELIASLELMVDAGYGNNEVAYKNDGYYMPIELGATKCCQENGDVWHDYYWEENACPSYVEDEESFYKMIVLE